MSESDLSLVNRDQCPVCSNEGKLLYTNLTDRLFSVPGTFSMKKCTNTKCKTIWLDPSPHPEKLYLLYQDYSTHEKPSFRISEEKNWRSKLQKSYLYRKYGYGEKPDFFFKVFWFFVYIYPAWKDMQDMSVFFTPKVPGGKFLDVGCGNGNAMIMMKSVGWEVFGIDIDENALQTARSMNLEVKHGTLLSAEYADESFDSILMSNVIEHVPNPSEIISECYRILKKGGTLTIITPNISSFGSKIFKENWRGLETPQHLQIFNKSSLDAITNGSGFNKVKTFTSPHSDFYVISQSLSLLRSHKISYEIPPTISLRQKISRRLFSLLSGYLNLIFDKSEALVMIAKK